MMSDVLREAKQAWERGGLTLGTAAVGLAYWTLMAYLVWQFVRGFRR